MKVSFGFSDFMPEVRARKGGLFFPKRRRRHGFWALTMIRRFGFDSFFIDKKTFFIFCFLKKGIAIKIKA